MNKYKCNDVYRTVGESAETAVTKMFSIKNFVFNEFIYGSHWLSLNASAIALSMMLLLGITIKWEFLLIVYLLIQCVYNYNHYKELETDISSNSPRVNHLKKYQKYLPYIIKAYGAGYLILLICFGNLWSFLLGGFLLTVGLLYTTDSKDISKKVVGFKSVYTAFAWALLIFLTALYCSYPINISVIIFFIFVFLQLIITTSYFDIKDMQSDSKEGLLTLPLIFQSKQKLLNFLHILNIASFLPITIGVYIKILPIYALSTLFLSFYVFYYLQRTKNDKSDIHFLSYIMVDGQYNFWPVILFLGLIVV